MRANSLTCWGRLHFYITTNTPCTAVFTTPLLASYITWTITTPGGKSAQMEASTSPPCTLYSSPPHLSKILISITRMLQFENISS